MHYECSYTMIQLSAAECNSTRALFYSKNITIRFFSVRKMKSKSKTAFISYFCFSNKKQPQFKECLLKESQCQNIVIFDRNGIHCACSTRFCGRAGDSEICHYNCECNGFEIFPGSSSTET